MDNAHLSPGSACTSVLVRQRIERRGEGLWRYDDFRELPFTAVAQALSRLTKEGALERLSKGTYYRSRQTAFGQSRPNPLAVQNLVARRQALFPSGLAAANHLGFSTQATGRSELATCASSLPRKLIGQETIVHVRRPAAWTKLLQSDAALLDFLRNRGETSELRPDETIRKTLALLTEGNRWHRLFACAQTEPPRVRALLGALGGQIGKSEKACKRLRESLNPLSKFEFGVFAGLPNARAWQAKERR